MDDIYHRLLFNNARPINCYDFAKDHSESSKLIIINGVSKQYAMTGFRIGWAVANKKLIEVMTNIQGTRPPVPPLCYSTPPLAPSTVFSLASAPCRQPSRTTATS